MVEVCKPKERLYVFNVAGGISLLYHFNFGRVHTNTFMGDDQSPVSDCLCLEVAFLWFQEDLVILDLC